MLALFGNIYILIYFEPQKSGPLLHLEWPGVRFETVLKHIYVDPSYVVLPIPSVSGTTKRGEMEETKGLKEAQNVGRRK